MNKYKLLRFGKMYVNTSAHWAVIPIRGNRKKGYTFLADSDREFPLGEILVESRIVPNDGSWVEVGIKENGN